MKLLWLTLVLFGIAEMLSAQSTTQWRGLDRTGHYPNQQLADSWPEAGPELLLHVEDLPESYSSVVVQDEILYTTGIEEEQEFLTAIDGSGKILWNTHYGKAWTKSYRPARCTPTIEGEFAYVISGSGTIACIQLNDGSVAWSVEGAEKFEAEYGSWGIAESPLIVGSKLIYTPCGALTTMVALDKLTGSTLWKSESIQDISGYTSPIVIERGGKEIIITVTGNWVIGVDAANGAILWKFNYGGFEKPMMGEDINPVTPLVKGDEVFVTSGYNHVGIMLSMINDYSDVELKWYSEDLDVHHGGVVEVEGYIYGSNYLNIRKGNWVCLEWETGKTRYNQEWHNKGQIIFADGKFICYDERRGNIGLVKAGPEKFEVLSAFKVSYGNGPHWSHPSIYGNKMYLRHGKSLLVYSIGEIGK